MNEDNELTPRETEALRRLSDGPPPPPDLEARTVAHLAARGLLVRRRTSRGRTLLAAAAGLLVFFAGAMTGSRLVTDRSHPGGDEAAGTRFALLLYQSPGEIGLAPEVEASRVAEYLAWARSLAAEGRAVTGEKLDDLRHLVAPPSPPAGAATAGTPVAGFFIVTAASLDEALGVARTCPHLKYGGTIEVRTIAGT